MGVFPGIFFNMHLFDTDFFLFTINFDFNPTIMRNWFFMLRNLVGLRVIRVKIVLPVKVRVMFDFSM